MRLIRFMARSFHEGRIVEPGEEMLVNDDVHLGAHMQDLTHNETPLFAPRVVSVFRGELAQEPNNTVPGAPPSETLQQEPRVLAEMLSPEEARMLATEEAIARADARRAMEESAAD